jgi:hypothetical protein
MKDSALRIGALICGPLADHFGRKPVLIGCAFAFGVCSLITRFHYRTDIRGDAHDTGHRFASCLLGSLNSADRRDNSGILRQCGRASAPPRS